MTGYIKTHLLEKQYGFIKGDDGKDYFFHFSGFQNQNDVDKICDGLFLEFEQKITPKGYNAVKINLVNKNDQIGYIIPETIYTSKEDSIKGWEIIDKSNWIINGSSRESPEHAKTNMIKRTQEVGANALINVEYYKTTGSEAGTGSGIHYYTVHNFKGRAANIAKKSPQGQYTIDDLTEVNIKAKNLKLELQEKTSKAQLNRIIFWLLTFVVMFSLFVFNKQIAIFGSVIILVIAFLLSHATNYDSWLEEER